MAIYSESSKKLLNLNLDLDDIQSGDIDLKDYRDPRIVFTNALGTSKKTSGDRIWKI